MDFSKILENTLYIIAILNPASKVMFLAACEPPLSKRQTCELAWKSSLAGYLILAVLAAAGQFLLSRIFKVEMYSLRISGGLILFVVGWTAVSEGRFAKQRGEDLHPNLTDLSLVPLAAPLIAGPGTITVAITGAAEWGIPATFLSLFLAVGANFLLMLFSQPINRLLLKTHLLGPLIRLTGLIIAAVATQMIAAGVREFFG